MMTVSVYLLKTHIPVYSTSLKGDGHQLGVK